MAAPRKFDPETRERAVRVYEDRLAQSDDSKLAARRHVGELLGINQATFAQLDRGPSFGSRTVISPADQRQAVMVQTRCEWPS